MSVARRSKPAPQLVIGTWRSDRSRTAAEWVWRKKLHPAKRRKVLSIFGRLVHRYTRKRCFTTFEGKTVSGPYRVLWHGMGELAGIDLCPQLVIAYSDKDRERVQTLFFDRDDSYYVHIGRNVEYFKRVKPKRR